jgi:hypothetical protein
MDTAAVVLFVQDAYDKDNPHEHPRSLLLKLTPDLLRDLALPNIQLAL